MNKIISKEEFLRNWKFFVNEMKRGKIFIYPTDTIYGLGCNALKIKSIIKIRRIKGRETKPFSVIVPNKKWINQNCYLDKKAKIYIKKLPGKYTFILRIKNKKAISKEVNKGLNSLGIRIPNNWFAKIVSKTKIPFLTTSVNISGKPHIIKLDEIDNEIKKEVDYIIDGGLLKNKPSTIINFIDKKEVITKRN